MNTNETELGSIDVVAIGYASGAPTTGEAIPIFLELADLRTIKVLDVRFVRKRADGTLARVDPADLDADAAGDLARFAGAASGLVSDDAGLVAAEIEPGGAAVMMCTRTAGRRRSSPPLGATVARSSSTTASMGKTRSMPSTPQKRPPQRKD